MKYYLYLTIAIITLLSCTNNKDNSFNNKDILINQKESVDPFEREMERLVSKYPELAIAPYDTLPYKNNYYLVKRVFYPGLPNYGNSSYYNDITFEKRRYCCSGVWQDEIIYIYNDSIDFIIPLTDYYYYWQMSNTPPVSEEKKANFKYSFEKELNNFLKKNKNLTRFEAVCVINLIMEEMLDCFIVQIEDIPKLEFIAKTTKDEFLYNDSCKSTITKNLPKIEEEVKSQNKIVYSDGRLTFIIDFIDTNEKFERVEIETINCACYSKIII